MTHRKALTISLVIPVYNEEHNLPRCLDAIGAQIEMPEEVIVVDNNSTDNSANIANRYPFVKVLHETEQGITPARNRGFNYSTSDIIGRIDVDMKLAPDWTIVAKKAFEDSSVASITGFAKSGTVPLPLIHSFHTRFWSYIYYWSAESLFGVPIVWGSSMAIRDAAWHEIKPDIYLSDYLVHEDQDISILLASHGLRVIRDPKLQGDTNEEAYHYWPKFKEYMSRSSRTRSYHQQKGSYKSDKLIKFSWPYRAWLAIACFVPGLLFIITSFISYLPHYIGF